MSTLVAVADPVAAFRAVLVARAAATGETLGTVRSHRHDGDEPPYVLLREAGAPRERNAPVMNPARVAIQVFELDEAAAAAGYRRISALAHRAGPMTVDLDDDGSVGVWKVFDETGVQTPVKDPDTGWWIAGGVFDLYMTDRSVG